MRSLRHALILTMLGVGLAGTVQADEADVVAVIYQAADNHGIGRTWLLNVARCESTLNPNARGRLGEQGLMQLLPGGELDRFYARGYTNPWSAEQSADYAAARFAEGGSGAWSCAR